MTQLNSEAAVIGSVCIDANCFPVVERRLTVDDFGGEMAKAAFSAALELRNDGKPIDPVAIAEALGDEGVGYISECMAATPTAAHIDLYCDGVLERSKRRQIQDLAGDFESAIYGDFQPDEFLVRLRERTDAIDKGGRALTVSSAQASCDWLAYYKIVEGNPEYAYCKTGFRPLDYQLGGGLFRQGLYIVGARPGMGKTTLALNIAENIAMSGKPILFVSLEMSRVQVMSKRLAMAALLSYTDLMTGKLMDTDFEIAQTALDWLRDKPMALIDKSSLTTAEILKAARQVDGIQAIVVDYLGLIKPSDEAAKKPRYEQMTEISAELKAMAKTLDIPVMVLCQLNRENVTRADARPRLTDLRDSGAIEQDADAVILLHRAEYYKTTNADYTPPATEEIELIVAKNRHASTGVVKLAWNGKSGRITEFAKEM